jgi:hypothetical protein
MNIKDFIGFSDKISWKFVVMSVYTGLAVIVLYYFLRKRSTPPNVAQLPKHEKKKDLKPRVSISGKLITPASLRTLLKISKFTRLHLVFRVGSNEEEASIKEMIKDIIPQHRILFCETEIGYKAILRQLNPQLHLEDNLAYAREMNAYLNDIAVVSDEETDQFYQIIDFVDCEGMVLNILSHSSKSFGVV